MMDDDQAALAAVLESIQHMSRDEMKALLLDDNSDPEYVALVESLLSQEDLSQEALVECFKEMLLSNAQAEPSQPTSSKSKTKKDKIIVSSSEDEEVQRRPKKRKISSSEEKSAESDDTVDLSPVKRKIKKTQDDKPHRPKGKVIATVDLDSDSDSEIGLKKQKHEKSTKHKPSEPKSETKSKHESKQHHQPEKGAAKSHSTDKGKDKHEKARDESTEKKETGKIKDRSKSSDLRDDKYKPNKEKSGKDEKRKDEKRDRKDENRKEKKGSHKEEKKKYEEKHKTLIDSEKHDEVSKAKEKDKKDKKKEDGDKRDKQKSDKPCDDKVDKAKADHRVKETERTEERVKTDVRLDGERKPAGEEVHEAVKVTEPLAGKAEVIDLSETSPVKEGKCLPQKVRDTEPKDTAAQEAVGTAEERTKSEIDAAKLIDKDVIAVEDTSKIQPVEKVSAPTVDKKEVAGTSDNKKEICFPPDFKVRVPKVPLVDPDFKRYKKTFKLKSVKIVLYDVRKQSRDMQEGDKVHRALLREEERKRKKDKNRPPERKEKYSERGTRILPFEKRPENADLYARKREIVREKSKTETQTEKQKRLAELHKKEREREEKKKATIHSGFRIPKEKKQSYNLVENIISSSTPLAPAAKVNKLHFDKRRIVSTTTKEESWGLTPEEKAALERLNKEEEKHEAANDDIIHLDDDYGVHDDDLFPAAPAPAVPQHDDDQDSLGYAPTDTPPSPIAECEVNDLSIGVVRLLFTETCIQLADENASHADVIMQKCGKWFRCAEHEPYYQASPSIPEKNEEEYYTFLEAAAAENDDVVSFVGNVSNPDGDDDLQDSEVTSTELDPDQLDEFCGAALLNAQLRVKPGDTPDCFRKILEVPRGLNYDKASFKAKCNLCEEQIANKRHLGSHLRSDTHRRNLALTSLKLTGMTSLATKESDAVSLADSKASDKTDASRTGKEKTLSKEEQEKAGVKHVKSKDHVKGHPKEEDSSSHGVGSRRDEVRKRGSRSRSPRRHRRSRSRGRRSRSRSRGRRSRSRGRMSRSRSPQRRHHRPSRSRSRSLSPRGRHRRRSRSLDRRRRSSRDHMDEFLPRNGRRRSRSPKGITSTLRRLKDIDDAIFKEKLRLTADGKWTSQLDGRWKLKEEEEETLKKIFDQKRKKLDEKPEDHPSYSDEWTKFWERRYQELTEEGKDAENYDYTPEWKDHWKKFSDALLEHEYAERMQEIRKKYGMDLETLRMLNAASGPPPAARPPPVIHSVSQVPILPFNPLHSLPPMIPGIPPPMVIPPIPAVPPVAPVPPPVYPVRYPTQIPTGVPPPVPVQSDVAVVGSVSDATRPNAAVPPNLTQKPQPVPSDNRNAAAAVDYTAKSMSISSGSEGGSKPAKVTVDDVKNTWLNYTGQKISAAVVEAAKSVASGASSGKSQNFDYDGLDVVATLRLMLNLEDELSFLALQVENYYKEAEKLEAEESKKSFTMLREPEFVTLLQQCRDKFYSVLRANVSPSDVMKKLNVATFALNALLESSACQKLRTSAVTAEQSRVSSVAPKISAPGVSDRLTPTGSNRCLTHPIAEALAHLPQRALQEISSVIASSLIAQGRDRLNDSELNANLLTIFAPVLAGSRSRATVPGRIVSPPLSAAGSNLSIASLTTDPQIDAGTAELPASSVYRSIPPLPEIGARAPTPPAAGLVPEGGTYGVSSFLPGRGGGSLHRHGRGNFIPEDQDHSELVNPLPASLNPCGSAGRTVSTRQELSELRVEDNVCSVDSEHSHSLKENQNVSGTRTVKTSELRKSSADSADVPYDPEVASFSSGEIIEEVEAPKVASVEEDHNGPSLPPGILNLIERDREARKLGEGLEYTRPDRRVKSIADGASSISSVTDVGDHGPKRSKRRRRKSKKLKKEKGIKEHRKKRRRHSERSRSREKSHDGPTLRRRRSVSPSRGSDYESRGGSRRQSRDNEIWKDRSRRRSRSIERRASHKSDASEGRSKRHHRSRKHQHPRDNNRPGDSKVAGVSNHFWNESGSAISSEDNFPPDDRRSKSDSFTKGDRNPHNRRLGSAAPHPVEDGELVSSSEANFSDSPVAKGKLEKAEELTEVVSEEEDWDKGDDFRNSLIAPLS